LIRGKFGDEGLSIVKSSDPLPSGGNGVGRIVVQLVIGVKLESYEVRGFMSPVFQRDVEAILNMNGVGLVCYASLSVVRLGR
jgi:hypothetical protein